MKNNNDPIKQENKKALPRFILIVALSLVLGGVLGIALVNLGLEEFDAALVAAGLFFTNRVAPWLIIALPVAELAVCLPIYFNAKGQLSAWDGEDELVSGEVEAKLSVCIWITGLCTVLAFFLLAAMFAGFVGNAGTPRMMPAPPVFRRAGGFPGGPVRPHGAPAEAGGPDQAAQPGEKGLGVRHQVPENVVRELRRGGAAHHRPVLL